MRLPALVHVTLVALVLAALPAAGSEESARHVDAVKEALKKGDLDGAASSGEKAVAADPKSADAHLWLGRAYGQKAMKASLFSQMGLAKKCRASFEKSVELDGSSVEARWDLMQYYLRAPGIVGGGTDKALAQAGEIAKLDAVRGAIAKGLVYDATKDAAHAEEELKRAFAQAPKDGRAQSALIGFYAGHDRFDEAFAVCRKAQEADPDSPLLHYQTGRLAALSGKELERGAAELDLFLAKEPPAERPSWADAHWRKGQILARMGKKTDAKVEQQAALKLDPGHKGAQEELKKLS